jgi:2-dehydro-3-deoxyphosphooctonate aldolase (KDO 8-P synthase)
VAAGCDGVFVETHVDPRKALSDRDNAIPFAELGGLWNELRRIDAIVGS